MEKKKVILTLCKSFPVTHSKAGEATDFEKKLKDKSKIHTIRYNAKNVWNGRYKDIVSGKKYLSIREWTGRPYNSEQKEIAQLPKIGLQHVVTPKKSFTENIYAIVKDLVNYKYSQEEQINYALHQIRRLSEILKINLLWHIEQKMYYNEGREDKHGKEY